MTMHMKNIGGIALVVCLYTVSAGCDGTAKAEDHSPPTTVAAPVTPAPAPAPAITTTPMAPLRFAFASDMTKVGGEQEDGAFVCRKDICKSGIVAYGPYTKVVQEGQRVATFRISAAGVSGLDKEAAALDVYDAAGRQRLALRSVKGNELPDNQQKSIELAFTAPATSKLEFRVRWRGEGELKLYDVEVH